MSKGKRAVSCVTASASIVGSAMMLTPLAPIGVGIAVASAVADFTCSFFDFWTRSIIFYLLFFFV